MFVSIKATRVKDKQSLIWRVPGKIAVDTVPPGDVQNFLVRSTTDGTALKWQAPAGEDLADLSYLIEKANINDGIYHTLGSVAITEYLDVEAVAGQDYYYRIRTMDTAGNEGTAINKRVTVFKPGPTDIGGLLEGDINFPAIGNPYRLSANVTIAASANIRFDQGTIIELQPEQTITVQGNLSLAGTESSPVTVRGDGWRLIYDGSGASNSRISYARLSGLNSLLKVSASQLALANLSLDGVTTQLEQNGQLNIADSVLLNASPAIRLVAGSLVLNRVRLVNNIQAIINADNSGQVSLGMADVSFDRNQIALSSVGAYTIANASFGDASLSEIQSMLDGPISLDWGSIGNGQNLIRDWLEPNMNKLKRQLGKQSWNDASQSLATMNQILPSEAVANLSATLAGAQQGFSPVDFHSGGSFGGLLSDGNRLLWIQSETLPTMQAKSEELSERAILKKFGKSYVKELFPNKSSTELTTAIRGVNLENAIDASQYLYSVNKGLLSDVWVLHVVNQSVLTSMLASAGLGNATGSNKVFTVNIDNSDASNLVLDILEAQKIRYKVSSAGRSPTPVRISATVIVSDSESQISKNLNVAEATIRFTLEDTSSNKVLGSWKSVGSASAFGKSDAQKRALETAISKVESMMVRRLWEVDSMPELAVAPASTPKPAVFVPKQVAPTPKPAPIVAASKAPISEPALPKLVEPDLSEVQIKAEAEVDAEAPAADEVGVGEPVSMPEQTELDIPVSGEPALGQPAPEELLSKEPAAEEPVSELPIVEQVEQGVAPSTQPELPPQVMADGATGASI